LAFLALVAFFGAAFFTTYFGAAFFGAAFLATFFGAFLTGAEMRKENRLGHQRLLENFLNSRSQI
jgi:polyferredoxin